MTELAFPGAMGWGRYAEGGRDGTLLHVTSLSDSGPGTLRWALEEHSFPRHVVFDVGGEIRLSSQIEITDPYVTVDGWSAPGPGITITRARIKVNASHVIVCGLTLTPGADPTGADYEDRDCISIGNGKRGQAISHIIVDHNTLTGATDETAAIWGNVSYVTLSNNIIADPLNNPDEPGRSRMGVLISGGNISKITIARNFFENCEDRNPYIRDASDVEIVNNYIRNYGDSGMRLSNTVTANVIGNVFEAGANSPERAPLYLSDDDGNSSYFLRDNLWYDSFGAIRDGTGVAHTSTDLIAAERIFPDNVAPIASNGVIAQVLNQAGSQRRRVLPRPHTQEDTDA